ncbi:LOW QUALITY PROTEIN: uncharacterized protein FYW35_008319 [Pterocles gutturalis]
MAARSQGSLQRRLQSAQEAQHRQGVLVRKLQEKVLQYRARCRWLEQQVEAGGGSLPGGQEAAEAQSLEKALLQVEEEQRRCEDLAEVNALLRAHLDKANEVNSALKEDVGKLTADWMRAREELELKEREWRKERELYENRFRGERTRLLSLWHQVVAFRRHFVEMKTATDRDLSELKAEQMRLSGLILANSSCLSSGVQLWESARVMELSALLIQSQKQNEEKEKNVKTLDDMVELLLEQGNDVLSAKLDDLEKGRICEQEKLNLCERRNAELCAEKARLEQLLKQAEEQQEELQVELRALAAEKAETQEKLSQVSRQQESASSGLEQLRQESSRQGHALAKVSQEKELLVHEKAALEARLAAVERHRQGLSEQLAEARSVKETLESSLFEAQQHLFQLKVARSQLEMQLHTVTQAKEVLQGEVTCLQSELEAEKQERENMAQQLSQTAQQYNTLQRESDHEGEIKKLLQDLANERERHHSELEMLEQREEEKAEREEERTRAENAKQAVLLEKEREKDGLLTLLLTQGELREACQRVEQLRQELKEQRENGLHITEKLQAELQESQSKIQAGEKRHREEIKTINEEMNSLLQQRDALQKQVEELTSQLAASEESQQVLGRKAQQDLSEAQELSRQKVLEVVNLQKILDEKRSQWEEVELQNKELQVCLQSLERERSRWEEVKRQNAEFQALLEALESEKPG